MTDSPTEPDPVPPPWDVRVNPDSGEAYRPNELIVEDRATLARLRAVLPEGVDFEVSEIEFSTFESLLADIPANPVVVTLSGADDADIDVIIRAGVAGELVDDDGVIRIQHSTVFLADACQCAECPPHPALGSTGQLGASPVWASPVWASPVWASPVWASGVSASPVWASPVWASPVWASGRTSNTALPADTTAIPRPVSPACQDADTAPTVIILDTGLADLAQGDAPLLPGATVTSPDPPDRADSNADNVLDPVAGHGTFIAGLVELAAPGARMRLPRVIRFRGDTDVPTFLNAAIAELSTLIDPADLALTRRRLERTVLGMSFSGALSDVEISVARQGLNLFRRLGIVAVASAGNNSSCEPLYPAAFGDPTDSERLANVVSVGALGRCGPATFTNYGCWVRACAAGEMLTSSFFTYDEPWGGFRQFDGWAQWSGTSFSVGIVIGSFLREMRLTGSTAADAVKRLVDAPDLPAIHNLGTIVT